MWVTRRLSDTYSRTPADFFTDQGLYLVKANNDRIPGWRICKDLLYRKKFKIFRGWADNFIRTVPQLPRSPNNPEDLDTRADDHCADAFRYCAMHVWAPHKEVEAPKQAEFQGGSVLSDLRPKRYGRKAKVYA